MRISIIIATYNRSQFLGATLQSLLDQKMEKPQEFEVIVVDNNSTDDTKRVVESFMPAFNGGLRYLFEERKGKTCAVNKGIWESAGDIIAFTDDDVIVDPRWLDHLVRCFETTGCDGFGGRVLPKFPSRAPKWIRDNYDLTRGAIVNYDYGEHNRIYEKPMLEFLGANMAFKKALFEELGDFRLDLGPGHEVLGEDTEITNRFFNAGKKIYYCGEAFVWHPVEPERMTLKYITKWYTALGQYRVIVEQEEHFPEGARCLFGIPVGLVKRFFREGFYFLTHIVNTRERLRGWVDLCVTSGKIKQIKVIRRPNKEIKI